MGPTRVILLEDFQPMHISDRVVTQEDHKDGLFCSSLVECAAKYKVNEAS